MSHRFSLRTEKHIPVLKSNVKAQKDPFPIKDAVLQEKDAPLLFAIQTGDPAIVESVFNDRTEDFMDRYRTNPFLTQARGSTLRHHPDHYTMSDMMRYNALYIAQKTQHHRAFSDASLLGIFRILLEHGASPDKLLSSISLPNATYDALKDYGVDINASISGNNALFPVTMAEKEAIAKTRHLMQLGIDVNSLSLEAGTALHVTIANERPDLAIELIDCLGESYNPELRDAEGKTALIIAAKAMQTPVVEKLLATYPEIDVNAKDKEGRTALHYACAYGLQDMVTLLLANGADITAKDRVSGTPRDYAGKLSPAAIRRMMESIEIYPDRDEMAMSNSITNSQLTPFEDNQHKALRAQKSVLEKHFTDLVAVVDVDTNANRNQDVAFLKARKDAYTGTSLIKRVLEDRKKLKHHLDETIPREIK